ncbi:MAG: helix-turn-helix transcriptional regulator [Cyclobacteriaceae bacterium]|nr:helix-turn-helix transcriptional regulator [Cyclobacteriaceae bacterium]
MEIIHKNIHFLREKRGWTQTQLAEKIGVSKSMIGAYEEFRSVPLLVVTKKLALVFDVSLDEFVRDDLSKKTLTIK